MNSRFIIAVLIISMVLSFTTTVLAITPDIKANGSAGPITSGTGDTLSVNISLAAGGSMGVESDWWVAVKTPFAPPNDWYHYDLFSGWMPGLTFTYQGTLFDLSPFVLNMPPGLLVGTYTFYFAVDTNRNGSLDIDQLFSDSVVVTVESICTYSISSNNQSFGDAGGTGNVNVIAPSGCTWTTISSDSWITIDSGSSGSGDDTVNYSVATYTGTGSRTGTMTIAGKTFTVTQLGAGASPVPDIKANGSDGSITLTEGDIFSVTVALDPGGLSGNDADWWVAAETPFGWMSFVLNVNSFTGFTSTDWVFTGGSSITDSLVWQQSPLFNLSTLEVLNISWRIPVGTYTFYFMIDMNMNGIVDNGVLFSDSVVVNITP